MKRPGISQILETTSKLPDKQAKIDYLRLHFNQGLAQVLVMIYHPQDWIWDLPETDPPYEPNPFPNQDQVLYKELKSFYLYMKDGHPGLTRIKRESLFIRLLTTLDPEDAKLILAAKRYQMPYEGIDAALILEALPGLLDPNKLPPPPRKKREVGPNRGKKFSDEHKQKLREAALRNKAKKEENVSDPSIA